MIRRIFQEEEVFNLELKAHNAGAENGRSAERRRILALLSDDAEIWNSENLQADLVALIKKEEEVDKVTRLEIIGNGGRLLSLWNLQDIELSYQDNGRTLKIFVSEETKEEDEASA
jgi:hypothetical protein